MFRPVWVLLLLPVTAALAQQPGPALTIDTNVRRPISPDIYGINFYWDIGSKPAQADLDAAAAIRPTVRRWGGNNTSTYNWKYDVWNIDSDWFFEVLPDNSINASRLPEGSSFNAYVDRARSTGGKVLGTIPVLGWLPKVRAEACSFDEAKYGKQCKVDPYAKYHPMTCGNGIVYDSACGDSSVPDGKAPKSPVYIKNDPNDAYAQFTENFQSDWIRYLVSRYGNASEGGVAIWALGNEPIWWDSTHRDIHPDPYTYDELLDTNMRYAKAIKQADPTALIAGPVADNWASLWLSKKDIAAGWARGNYWSNPVDRNAHGGVALTPWYLQQFRNYEQKNGVRLLDYLDLHAYIGPSDASKRLEGTREFWDPSYVVTGDYWIKDIENNGANIAPRFIPRVREMIDQNYPGTRLAITEYNYGGLDTLNGALAQADLLGIFGREGVDLATLWGPPKPTDPAAFAFKIFRNYDGMGSAFGDTSVRATSADQGKLSVYAALRGDDALTILAINKTASDLSTSFNTAGAAQMWLYSAANLKAIVRQPDVDLGTVTLPANSIAMLVVPPAATGTKPVVNAVTSAASYDQTLAPGQMVVVWGSNLGTDAKIFFDGIPAPMIYSTPGQASAIIPYFVSAKSHVQVESQGVRSDPFEIAISPTAPGLFSADFSGKGQGAVLNDDGITKNSAANPARAGSIVILWGTGEGITDPPGVDGRVATTILPKPVAPVSVLIGGLPATVEYAGAAPGAIPGLFQINARMSANVQPGNSVPVSVKVGNRSTQDGITIAVR